MAQSIEGLKKIIITVIKRCRKEGLIINLKKSMLLLTKKQQTELQADIAACPILKHFDQKTKTTYLGAITSPGKIPVYKHIQQRLAKAHSVLHEMTLRGFHVDKLGISTVTKIIKSTLIPILSYAMEAFPLKENDYQAIDLFLDQVIEKTTNNRSEIKQWNHFELQLTKPSLRIKKQKINMMIKIRHEPNELNAQLQKSYPGNFLEKEIKQIELDWDFNTHNLIDQYMGTKIVPKHIMKLQLANKKDKDMSTLLSMGNWENHEYPPDNLPEGINKPDKRLLNLRDDVIFAGDLDECKLCKQHVAHEALHYFSDCTHHLKVTQRQAFWDGVQTQDQTLLDYMSKLKSIQALRIATGLINLNNQETSEFLIRNESLNLCNLCYYPS